MLNRCAVVVRKRQPFLDWLLQLPDPVDTNTTLEQLNNDPHVYLLPELVYMSEQEALIAEFCETLFERELEGWWREPEDWPRVRNPKTFKIWFDVEFHSCIDDLEDFPLVDDRDEHASGFSPLGCLLFPLTWLFQIGR